MLDRGSDAVGCEDDGLRKLETRKLVISLAEDVMAQVRAPNSPEYEDLPV